MPQFTVLRRQIGLTLCLAWLFAVSAAADPYRNPVLFADYSDPDVVRVADDYYLVASSFQCVPGLPILHSRDLVRWTLIAHAVDRLPSPDFDKPQHGNGLWAPSLRHHDGFFWIYVGDPDRGIFMTRARDVRGPWEPLTLVKEARGWIDPCPLWDDDGAMYLVHAWAKSRAGFNGVLTVNRMSDDGRRVIDDGTHVFDGRERHPTIEGPKFYKRNGWYYIFAPAGGVKTGWQTVLRSKNVFGPYEDKIVLDRGMHQGAWIDDWFVHFRDRGAYGRVVHLQPLAWVNDWPVIGEEASIEAASQKSDASNEFKAAKESASARESAACPPQCHPERVVERARRIPSGDTRRAPSAGDPSHPTPPPAQDDTRKDREPPRRVHSDEFNADRLALDWQWLGNPAPNWYSLHKGALRLSATPGNLWSATNLLLQKLPAPAFEATTIVDAKSLRAGERAGLIVMGADYSALVVERTPNGLVVRRVTAPDADNGGVEKGLGVVPINGPVHLRVSVAPQAVARFSYSSDGRTFHPLGTAFVARPGRWIGAKVGLFGHADFDWFRIEETQPAENASLIVDANGGGDFRTIQEAIDAIPSDNSQNQTILIRAATYREKIMIATSHIALVGEDRDRTRIEYAELRRNWRASRPDDWGAAVINIGPEATDIVIANLTVHNTYGGDHDHQFAIRSMVNATRIAVLNANVIADGGDTFSLWNHDSGLSYAADSYFEGWVDYVCPRGWAYITNSRFFGHSPTASIWHDGSRDREQKFVIRHSRFDGDPDVALGRNHRDAQFYLLDASLSPNIADRAIYAADAPDPQQWGERYYYSNVHRDGGDFAWLADNLDSADGSPRDEDITATWTFGGRWDPATIPAVLPFASIPNPENGWRWVDPTAVTLRWTPARNAREEKVFFGTSPDQLRATGNRQPATSYDTGPLVPGTTYYWRIDDGPVWSFRTDPRTVRIALVGDSTVTETTGWGRGFKAYVVESAAVINVARGGRSSKSFAAEGHWAEALRQSPTHVIIQFGHNDQPGKGLDRETDLPTFRANMARYVDEARAIGATPILVTPLTRRNVHDLGDYANATRQVAAEKNVPLIDLYAKSITLLDRLGPSVSVSLGPIKTDGTFDKTHLNDEGTALFGALMAEEVARIAPDLAKHIRVKPAKTPVPVWSVRMADSVMKRTPDPMWLDATDAPRWEYTPGLVLKAILDVAQRTGDERYWKYVIAYYDRMIAGDGTIRGGYKLDDYNIDRINPGKPLFALYAKTRDEKYRKAIETLRRQLREHPRTSEGGFWHKKRYPNQMWLDGLYMGAPFLAQYAKVFNEPAAFDDVINQFVWMETHARDEKTGLLFHGWDESRQQKWADPKTGRSPALWGRAMGWYAMGLVETLDFVPLEHPRRRELIAILGRLAEAVTRVQDPKTGLWWQVVDQGAREGNYLEASVSTMLSFALLKASRHGYIDAKYGDVGRRAYGGILKQLIDVDKDGLVNLNRVCQVAGLGGDPERGERYRDGTFAYYVNEKIRSNDPKGVGPFIFASLEMERR